MGFGRGVGIPSASPFCFYFIFVLLMLDYSCSVRCDSYVGEVGLWTGIWALAVPSLATPLIPGRLGPLIGTLSPLFTYLLLTKARVHINVNVWPFVLKTPLFF